MCNINAHICTAAGSARGCFPRFWLHPFPVIPIKGNLNATTYADILNNRLLPTLW